MTVGTAPSPRPELHGFRVAWKGATDGLEPNVQVLHGFWVLGQGVGASSAATETAWLANVFAADYYPYYLYAA